MKRILSLILAAALCLSMATALASCSKKTDYTVGICQLMKHDALDSATQGFIDALNKKMGEAGKTVEIITEVPGEANLCPTVINTFVSKGVDLIMANATPALLSAANATKTIPVLGTSVTSYSDTFASGIPSNVSGTSDGVSFESQAQMMIDSLGLVAGDKVGVIYCSNETNSVLQYNKVKAYFEGKGVVVTAYTFSETTELQSVSAKAASESKAIYVPSDNTVSANEKVVDAACTAAGVPVFTSYGGDICYASLAIDYYQLGYKTGEMAAEVILGNKTVAELGNPDANILTPTVQYNKERCTALGITVPEN